MGSKRTNNYTFWLFLSSICSIWILIGFSVWYSFYSNDKQKGECEKAYIENVNDICSFSYAKARSEGKPMPKVGVLGRYKYAIFDNSGNLLQANASNLYGFNIKSKPDVLDVLAKTKLKENKPNHTSHKENSYLDLSSYYPHYGILVVGELKLSADIYSCDETRDFKYLIIMILGGIISSAIIIYIYLRQRRNIDRLLKLIVGIRNHERIDSCILNESWNDPFAIVAKEFMQFNEERNAIIEKREEEREKSIIEEKNKLRSKRILTNNLKHELKTPIGIIQGYLETMVNHDDLPEELTLKFLNNCLKNVRRIDNLVSSLSIATRLDDGASNIIMNDVSLKECLDMIKEDQTSKLRSNEIVFSYDISDDIILHSNSSLLYALFHNLVKNAINYAECSEIGFAMIAESDKDYTFEFWDNGKGVPEESLPRLFERFYRVEGNNAPIKEGSGLGLPIVESMIKLHHCTIKAINRENGGLAFIFNLPKKLGSSDNE